MNREFFVLHNDCQIGEDTEIGPDLLEFHQEIVFNASVVISDHLNVALESQSIVGQELSESIDQILFVAVFLITPSFRTDLILQFIAHFSVLQLIIHVNDRN